MVFIMEVPMAMGEFLKFASLQRGQNGNKSAYVRNLIARDFKRILDASPDAFADLDLELQKQLKLMLMEE